MPHPVFTSAALSVLLASAAVSPGQDIRDEDFIAGPEIPPAPAGRILDQGRIFSAEEEEELSAELQAFASANAIDLYVVGYSFLLGETNNERNKRLIEAWDVPDDDRDTILLLYTQANESLNIARSDSLSNRLSGSDYQECTNAAFEAAKESDSRTPDGGPDHAGRIRAATTALASSIGYTLENQTFLERIHRRGYTPRAAAIIGITCLGSGLWLLVLKHFENRRREEKQFYYFPTLPVGERLGAPFGGGNAYVHECKNAAAPGQTPASKAASTIARAAL